MIGIRSNEQQRKQQQKKRLKSNRKELWVLKNADTVSAITGVCCFYFNNRATEQHSNRQLHSLHRLHRSHTLLNDMAYTYCTNKYIERNVLGTE